YVAMRASSVGGDGLACIERARYRQPADRRLAHGIAARQIGLDRALGEALDRFLALMGSERLRTSKTHAACFGALPAVVCTRSDQFTLELGQAAEHCDHQLAVRRGGIRPGVMKRTEASTGLADRIDDVEQVAGRAREAIEAGDDKHIAGFQPANHLRQLGPVSLRARDLLFENVAAAGGLQLGDLAGQILVARRHPCISESSHFLSSFESDFRINKASENSGQENYSQLVSFESSQQLFAERQDWCRPPARRSWRQPPAVRPRLV